MDRKSRIRIADKAAQRFEQRVIGFLASVSFYALAAGNSQVWMTIDLVQVGNVSIAVYLHESLTPEQAIDALIKSYKAWAVNRPRSRL